MKPAGHDVRESDLFAPAQTFRTPPRTRAPIVDRPQLFLAWKADSYAFDAAFYAVQVVELVAGAVNLALLGLNVRDGLRLTGRRIG